jgi:hypothetical protein
MPNDKTAIQFFIFIMGFSAMTKHWNHMLERVLHGMIDERKLGDAMEWK